MKKILVMLLAIFSTHIQAQEVRDNGFYVAVTTGPTSFTFPNGDKLTSNGYQFGVGYDFNKFLAAELTYGSLYKSSSTFGKFDESITATNFSVLAFYPMENVRPYAKLGYTEFDVKYAYPTSTYKETGERLVYGVGAELKLDQRTAARLEYTTTDKKKDRVTADYIHAGVIVRF